MLDAVHVLVNEAGDSSRDFVSKHFPLIEIRRNMFFRGMTSLGVLYFHCVVAKPTLALVDFVICQFGSGKKSDGYVKMNRVTPYFEGIFMHISKLLISLK